RGRRDGDAAVRVVAAGTGRDRAGTGGRTVVPGVAAGPGGGQRFGGLRAVRPRRRRPAGLGGAGRGGPRGTHRRPDLVPGRGPAVSAVRTAVGALGRRDGRGGRRLGCAAPMSFGAAGRIPG